MNKTTALNDDKMLAESRSKYFEESRFDPTNQKFGLFSYTGTLAIADKPYFTKTACHKNTEGEVPTKPRNFAVGATKRGKTADTYFSLPNYVSDNEVKKQKKREKPNKPVEVPWKPGGPINEQKSLFEHKSEGVILKPSHRGPDGLVVLEPKKIYTSPPKLGAAVSTPGLLIGGKSFEYQSEPYGREHQVKQEEIKKNKEKMNPEPFKPPNPTGINFFNDEKTFGETSMPKKFIPKVRSLAIYKHDRVFLPSNPSKLGSTIGKFPEYMENPIYCPKRRPPSEQIPWRPTTNDRSRPTPSITNCVKNLRSEFPGLRKNH